MGNRHKIEVILFYQQKKLLWRRFYKKGELEAGQQEASVLGVTVREEEEAPEEAGMPWAAVSASFPNQSTPLP